MPLRFRMVRFRTFPVLALVVGGMFLLTATGCVSNEYVIPKTELNRLSLLPPGQRGMHVQVVQTLGSRSNSAIENDEAVPDQAYADEFADYDQAEAAEAVDLTTRVAIDVAWANGGGGGPRGAFGAGRGRSGWRPRSPVSAGTPGGGPHGGGSGGFNFGNVGGGGGGGGDDLAIIAIIVVAVALMAAAGLAMTEGIRYDGFVQLHPEQPLHLKDPGGSERIVPLAALTPADVAATKEALVLDDETFGFRFDHRRALDRKGLAFKVDFGSLDSLCPCYSAAGLASNIQFGYFPHHRLGLLGTLTLGGGKNGLDQTFQRHSANVEAQFFPLELWRFHLGGFGHGGFQVARDEFGTRTGPAWGGGAMMEFSLTTRLALTGRMDYTLARTAPDGQTWARTSMFTAGLAIY